jgi:acyl homoserine lactone synthase
MQLIVVNENEVAQHRQLVEAMLRLRARVFAGRLNWQVDSHNGLERDRFDDQGPTYILGVESGIGVVGCVRLLPPIRSSMLNEVFPDLLGGNVLKLHERMIESSRFCIDRDPPSQKAHLDRQVETPPATGSGRRGEHASIVHLRTRILLAGIVEWSLAHGYDELVTATDVRFERLLNMVGWPLRRLGPPRMINETNSVAGSLEISADVLQSLMPAGYRSPFDRTARAG